MYFFEEMFRLFWLKVFSLGISNISLEALVDDMIEEFTQGS